MKYGRLIAAMVLVVCCCGGVWVGNEASAIIPPRSGVAAPPVQIWEQQSRFDPTWVRHRGQVVLVLYCGIQTEIPPETVASVSDWALRYKAQGLLVVVITEGATPPLGLSGEVVVVQDRKGQTRREFGITEDREYFLVDRYGRLQRRRINENFVKSALAESFSPEWVGFSTAWNQTYMVHRGQYLMYLADTIPDVVRPGETFDLRLVALPTFANPLQESAIDAPVQIEVRTDRGFGQEVYRAESNEDIAVSTELLLAVDLAPDAEPGLHVMYVNVRHHHCGFGNCGGFHQTVPVPVWVAE